MPPFIRKLLVAGIRLAVISDVPFDLSPQSKPFETDFDGYDTVFYMATVQKVRPEGFTLISSFGFTDIYRKDQELLKIYYLSRQHDQIGWSSWCSRQNPSEYYIFIGEGWKQYLNSINPLYFCDLSCFFADHQAIVLHSSLIASSYGGVLFTAPSGTGKSTQADLWVQYRNARLINGDRAVIRKEQTFCAYGSPYAGSSRIYKNEYTKLRAVVVLRQAPYNKIQVLRGRQAYLCLASEISVSSWDKSSVARQMDLLAELIQDVPVYMLECLPDEGAVQILEQTLLGEINGTK